MNPHKEEPTLERERTPEFYEAAKALSDYVNALDLDAGKNNELVRLMLDQVVEAEKGAFAHGFKLGMSFERMEQRDAATAPVLGGGCSS